jgi:RHS repeat-associated protein
VPPVLTTTNYNANNQQLMFGTTTETYDLNGNLATTTDAGVTTTYTWNARNHLTGISRTGLTASFSYDSFGRRTGKTVQGVTTNYVYDGLNPVQEKSGATVNANLLTGLGIDEFFMRTDGVGVRSLLPDALGSTVALGDGTGTLQTQYTYEPFGFVSQTGAASTNSYKYTGREDDGTGLLYYRARYYQPRFQRFISEDPVEFMGGSINVYTYVHNKPLRLIDPLGLAAGDWWDILENYRRARQITDEELRKHQGHNDCDDAIRHAMWNKRMTDELGYWYSWAFGTGHELQGLFQGQPFQEMRMDLHNNSVGRNTAGGSINQGNLQTSPGSGVSYPYQRGTGSSYPY